MSDDQPLKKILKCFRTNGCRKWRNWFKIEKFIVLAEYFEQQADCSGKLYGRNICHSRRRPSWRNQLYLPFLIKQMQTMPQSHITVSHLLSEWHWKSSFDFTEILNNYRLKYVKLWDLFPTFLWNCIYNFENIFTAWS